MPWRELSTVRLNGPDGGEAIPRLDELLAAWPEMRWNIDAKHDSAVDPLIETLRQTRRHRSGLRHLVFGPPAGPDPPGPGTGRSAPRWVRPA